MMIRQEVMHFCQLAYTYFQIKIASSLWDIEIIAAPLILQKNPYYNPSETIEFGMLTGVRENWLAPSELPAWLLLFQRFG